MDERVQALLDCVGQRVRFRAWDDMLEEYGQDGPGIAAKYTFTKQMSHLCETTALLDEICDKTNPHSGVRLCDYDAVGRTSWSYSLDMIEPLEWGIAKINFDEGEFFSMLEG